MKNVCTIGLFALTFLIQGCVGPFELEEGLFGPDPWGKPVWGKPTEAVRCRLSVYKRKWKTTETPTFTLDLQNNGKRTFAFWPDQRNQLCNVQVDGKWYQWSPAELIDSKVWNFSPGSERNGIIIELRHQYHIDLKPGRHVVRVELLLEDLRVVSNPVGIETIN
mgnify:CR=1 FL=1